VTRPATLADREVALVAACCHRPRNAARRGWSKRA